LRKKIFQKYLIWLALAILLLILPKKRCNELNFVSIGTGAVTGIYYPAGGAICRMINNKRQIYQIKATVEATAGSVYNVNAVLKGDLEFGVVQSDRQYQAYHGLSEWKNLGPQTSLRSVFSIHPETVNLLVSVKSGVKHILDLRERRVNIGNPGSGPLQNARDALSAFNITEAEIRAEYVKAVEAPRLLQDERIDAFFYTVGHPSGNIKEATSGRISVRFIPLEGPSIDKLLKQFPYYTKTKIPVHLYPHAQNTTDVFTFGVRGTLVSSIKVKASLVYAITKEIFDNLEVFKKLHPAFSSLNIKQMVSGLSAPIHPGALKYYQEKGLIKFIDQKLILPEEFPADAEKNRP